MTAFILSPVQQQAEDAFISWWNDGKPATPYFYLAGFAGTGKTTIAKHLVQRLINLGTPIEEDDEDVDAPFIYAYAAFTGKASLVLSHKGCSPSSTVHQLIYRLDSDPKTKKPIFSKRDRLNRKYQLLILDECSMVNTEMGTDLLSYKVPILVLGDPGQLPPVEGSGFFTALTPDFTLTEIHRQALDSPILQLATKARQELPIDYGNYRGENLEPLSMVVVTPELPATITLLQTDQILCGTNATRTRLNRQIRQAKQHFETLPQVGEKLICLKNNWNVNSMMNGSLWRVESIKPDKASKLPNRLLLELSDWDNPTTMVNVTTHACFFDVKTTLPDKKEWEGVTHFTFGYAITVHKSQDSEWNDIILFNEANKFRKDAAKWLYTAITRAAKNLIITTATP